MDLRLDDTIAAIGTPSGGAARGMIRLAGPQVAECVAAIFLPSAAAMDWRLARSAHQFVGEVRFGDGANDRLPCQLFYWPGERSYTRSPLAELHTLGSPPLLQATLARVCRHGARLAEPGEFTLRAFLAGRLDLTQTEAVLGVIDARGERDLHTALAQLAGGLSGPLAELRIRLLDLLAHLEAGLDFVEEDIEFITVDELTAAIDEILAALTATAAQLMTRNDAVDVARIVLLGPPNAGKSSLFNALLLRLIDSQDRTAIESIVSPIAGATRDAISARVTIAGQACELIDTAGWIDPLATTAADADRSIAVAAQRMTAAQREQASVRVVCLDRSQSPSDEDRRQWQAHVADSVALLTKADLPSAWRWDVEEKPPLGVSSATGAGLDELLAELAQRVASIDEATAGVVASTAARCRESLRLATEAVQQAHDCAVQGHGEELTAAELRLALAELGRVVGAVYTDDVLDRIFSRFCIGK